MFGGMCWYDDTDIQLNFFYSYVRSQMLYRIKPGNKFMLKRSSRTTRRKQWPFFRALSNAISCLAVDKHSYPFHFRLLQISSKQPKVKCNFIFENKCQHSVKCPKLLTTRLFSQAFTDKKKQWLKRFGHFCTALLKSRCRMRVEKDTEKCPLQRFA